MCVRCAGCPLLQRIKDWAVKMRKPEVPYSTIEECARHADIIGVSVAVLVLLFQVACKHPCAQCYEGLTHAIPAVLRC